MPEGIISKGVGGVYTVTDSTRNSVLCQIRGGIRTKKMTPSIGDRVVFDVSGDPDVPYVINEILPRKNKLVRPPLANIDCLVLTFATDCPKPDLTLLDKLLIICNVLNIAPAIIFTKTDLDEEGAKTLIQTYSAAGYKVLASGKDKPVSADEIKALSPEGIIAFAGPSGVGKSTLCNHLLEGEIMQVGDISERLGRGKHTTRHAELFAFGDGFITDTPGFTSLSLFELGIEYREVIGGYPEIAKLGAGCRFDDCRHTSERDCKVLEALDNNVLDAGRYERYRGFYEELYALRNTYTGRKKPNE